ncbi:Ubiquitin carboxyl-terminal hydrolase 37 [Umbelopsis sp. WA50703]
MELRDLLLRNFDCQVTVKSSSGNANTWSEAFISFVRAANGLLQIKIEQQREKETKFFSLTKNIKACYSWTNTAANRVTLKTLNPNATLTIDFHSKEDESDVGKFLKRIQYNQEDGEVELAQKQKTISIENHKKRKPVTYASRPPVQKKIATAFTPLNNFEEDVDCQSIQEPARASNDRPVFKNLENKSPAISPLNSPGKSPVKSPAKSPVKNGSLVQSPRRSSDVTSSPPRTPTRQSLPSSQGSENSSPIRNIFKTRSPTSSPRSSAGLSNLGNTCYLNSILQSIINLESFRHSLLNVKIHDVAQVEGTLFQSLTKVLRHRISNPNELIDHDILRECISRTSERFTKYQQEDSHEYLSICLNKLHHDTLRICNDYSENCSEPDVKKCPIDDNFQFRVQSTLSCTQCSWKSTHFEIFRDLSLNLPDSSIWQCNDPIGVDITTLLYQYFMDEKVSYKCEKCQCAVAMVQTKIDRAPRILVLHLKRFTKDLYEDVCQKRTDSIQLRPKLNLGKYFGGLPCL